MQNALNSVPAAERDTRAFLLILDAFHLQLATQRESGLDARESGSTVLARLGLAHRPLSDLDLNVMWPGMADRPEDIPAAVQLAFDVELPETPFKFTFATDFGAHIRRSGAKLHVDVLLDGEPWDQIPWLKIDVHLKEKPHRLSTITAPSTFTFPGFEALNGRNTVLENPLTVLAGKANRLRSTPLAKDVVDILIASRSMTVPNGTFRLALEDVRKNAASKVLPLPWTLPRTMERQFLAEVAKHLEGFGDPSAVAMRFRLGDGGRRGQRDAESFEKLARTAVDEALRFVNEGLNTELDWDPQARSWDTQPDPTRNSTGADIEIVPAATEISSGGRFR